MDVKGLFDEFVKSIGGELIESFLPNSPNVENADYFLERGSIICELKCLEIEYNDRIQNLVDQWMDERRIGQVYGELPFNKIIEGHSDQEELNREALNKIRKAFERVVKEANNQIKETKKYFTLPNSKGLLIIVNLANLVLEPDIAAWLLQSVLDSKRNIFKSIDTIIFLTIDIEGKLPKVPTHFKLWLQISRSENEQIDPVFADYLQGTWAHFIGIKLQGKPIPVMVPNDEKETINLLKYKK